MRRFIPLLAISLVGCNEKPTPPANRERTEVWISKDRDRLCIKGDRAGFIVYGEGNTNCSAKGRLSVDGDTIRITPDGETNCHFAGDEWVGDGPRRMMAFGPENKASGACDYYCGPGASLSDIQFEIAKGDTEATDLAGDSLC